MARALYTRHSHSFAFEQNSTQLNADAVTSFSQFFHTFFSLLLPYIFIVLTLLLAPEHLFESHSVETKGKIIEETKHKKYIRVSHVFIYVNADKAALQEAERKNNVFYISYSFRNANTDEKRLV